MSKHLSAKYDREHYKNLSKVEKEINWLSTEKQYYKMRKNALFQL